MSKPPARSRAPRMTNDAYAGFLRLLLTPLSVVPQPSAELDAYLSYLNAAAPLHTPRGRSRRAA